MSKLNKPLINSSVKETLASVMADLVNFFDDNTQMFNKIFDDYQSDEMLTKTAIVIIDRPESVIPPEAINEYIRFNKRLEAENLLSSSSIANQANHLVETSDHVNSVGDLNSKSDFNNNFNGNNQLISHKLLLPSSSSSSSSSFQLPKEIEMSQQSRDNPRVFKTNQGKKVILLSSTTTHRNFKQSKSRSSKPKAMEKYLTQSKYQAFRDICNVDQEDSQSGLINCSASKSKRSGSTVLFKKARMESAEIPRPEQYSKSLSSSLSNLTDQKMKLSENDASIVTPAKFEPEDNQEDSDDQLVLKRVCPRWIITDDDSDSYPPPTITLNEKFADLLESKKKKKKSSRRRRVLAPHSTWLSAKIFNKFGDSNQISSCRAMPSIEAEKNQPNPVSSDERDDTTEPMNVSDDSTCNTDSVGNGKDSIRSTSTVLDDLDDIAKIIDEESLVNCLLSSLTDVNFDYTLDHSDLDFEFDSVVAGASKEDDEFKKTLVDDLKSSKELEIISELISEAETELPTDKGNKIHDKENVKMDRNEDGNGSNQSKPIKQEKNIFQQLEDETNQLDWDPYED